MSKINLWKKRSGHFFSHKDGLRAEDVEFLHTLKVGDKLVAFNNERKDRETSPDLTIKVAQDRPQMAAETAPSSDNKPSGGGFRPSR